MKGNNKTATDVEAIGSGMGEKIHESAINLPKEKYNTHHHWKQGRTKTNHSKHLQTRLMKGGDNDV